MGNKYNIVLQLHCEIFGSECRRESFRAVNRNTMIDDMQVRRPQEIRNPGLRLRHLRTRTRNLKPEEISSIPEVLTRYRI